MVLLLVLAVLALDALVRLLRSGSAAPAWADAPGTPLSAL